MAIAIPACCWHEMEAEGRLTARVKVPFHFKPHMELAELDRASAMTAEFTGDWVRSGFVKMFMDGVVDSRTAYMLHDYPGTPGTRRAVVRAGAVQGDLRRDRPARACRSRCMRLAMARCGMTIDGYEAAAAANGPRDSRHRIEHIELIDRADIPRLGALGITAIGAAAASARRDGFPDVDDGDGDRRAPAGATPICGRRWPIMARRWPLPATGR